jgi:hypothetical protein
MRPCSYQQNTPNKRRDGPEKRESLHVASRRGGLYPAGTLSADANQQGSALEAVPAPEQQRSSQDGTPVADAAQDDPADPVDAAAPEDDPSTPLAAGVVACCFLFFFVQVHTLSGMSAFLEGLVVVSTCLALPQGLGCLCFRAACACELLHILPSFVSGMGIENESGGCCLYWAQGSSHSLLFAP